jgi:hypothetical protein
LKIRFREILVLKNKSRRRAKGRQRETFEAPFAVPSPFAVPFPYESKTRATTI